MYCSGGTSSNTEQAQFLKLQPISPGASVHHPAPGMTTRPSIAAVVASLDGHMVRHAASVRVQQHRKDVMADLQSMVKDLLITYYESSSDNKKPTRIIFLRDGVSEGQFKEVSHISYMFNRLKLKL
jgi:Piwi domain